MDKSRRLRLREVRAAFRLVGECRDLGAAAERWRRHLFEGLCRLIGARAGIGGESLCPRPHGLVRPIQSIATGFTPQGLALLQEYFRVCGPSGEPHSAALQRLTGRLVTRTNRQLVDDQTWYSSACYNDYHKPCDLDHCITSIYQFAPDGSTDVISLHRAVGERDFSPREQRLLHLFHGEVGRLISSALACAGQSDPMAGLSPRLRQTLACLLEGASEKLVARRLGLSAPTVHQYVTALYRYFHVHSRAELLASFLHRLRLRVDGPGTPGAGAPPGR